MTKFAAHDDFAVYATGNTTEEAIANARRDANEPEAQFDTAEISDELAAWIDENGWDGNVETFEVKRGVLTRTTDED